MLTGACLSSFDSDPVTTIVSPTYHNFSSIPTTARARSSDSCALSANRRDHYQPYSPARRTGLRRAMQSTSSGAIPYLRRVAINMRIPSGGGGVA